MCWKLIIRNKGDTFFKCPSVNIGSRQDGRLRADNVIDVKYNANEIYKAIQKTMNFKFRKKLDKITNPYGGGRAGLKIAKVLSNLDYNVSKLLNKKMTY